MNTTATERTAEEWARCSDGPVKAKGIGYESGPIGKLWRLTLAVQNQTYNRLIDAHDAGKRGWDNPFALPDGELQTMLVKAMAEHRWIDVINLAAFLLARDEWRKSGQPGVTTDD